MILWARSSTPIPMNEPMMHLAFRLQPRRSPLGPGPMQGVIVAFLVWVLYKFPLVPPAHPRHYILWVTTTPPELGYDARRTITEQGGTMEEYLWDRRSERRVRLSEAAENHGRDPRHACEGLVVRRR